MFLRARSFAPLALILTCYFNSLAIAEDAQKGAGSATPAEGAAPAVAPPTPGLSGSEVFNRMLPSTCWIRFESIDNGQLYIHWGTGWVYDIGRRLVVTNEHVIHNVDAAQAFFPQELDGETIHDPDWYVKSGQKFGVTVMDRDTSRDLALLQLDGLPDNVVALKLAEKSPLPGDRVFALGSLPSGSEGLWIMTTGEVRQVYRRSHANGHFARVVETQLPINRGNSGGAVVNDKLDVVAVVEGFQNEARLVSMFIDVNEVRDFLDAAVPLVEASTAADFETRAARRYDENRYDQAIEDYGSALRLDPKLASAMMNRGWAYLVKGDYETAAADFDAALKVDPELRGAYEGRGTRKRELGDYKAAIKDLTEAIRRDATDADTYERRAKCYDGLNKYGDALKDRNRAVELAPDYPDYLLTRGQTLRAMKQFAAAQKDIERAVSLSPYEPTYYYELGYVFFDQEMYQQARMFFDMAVQRDNTYASYVYMRGMADFNMDNWQAAAADINAALALKPDTAYYYWNLGIAEWNQDKYAESLQAYTNYSRVMPDEPAGYNDRADVYEAMGNEDLAAKDREMAKRLVQKGK